MRYKEFELNEKIHWGKPNNLASAYAYYFKEEMRVAGIFPWVMNCDYAGLNDPPGAHLTLLRLKFSQRLTLTLTMAPPVEASSMIPRNIPIYPPISSGQGSVWAHFRSSQGHMRLTIGTN